ncbi:hypothetical protein [Candidatus Enterococcus clewellii]|uniref:Uncharacterized protein n=1 Tax=Candidatus Enterococcus clewellii TaxID=1834193 RepID=A0A242KBW6_9ENTE|nr:hypothetical protein [Enterococcus sp. 9E7_DIV0242]OTP18456.1 hypothetical protein A5888_000270 [Enterococcus sp. 9E7_DIV0242]
MNVHVTRRTGFYGMATPIEVLKNGERWFMIANNSQKTLNVTENQVEVQVRFYFMKSEVLYLKNDASDKELEITMNPVLVSNYLVFFLLMLLIPLVGVSIAGILFVLLLYFIFLFLMLKKAYVIKEIDDGA